MAECSYFECLSYSPARCDNRIACTGCLIQSSCAHCARQETLIEGIKVPCEHIAAVNPAFAQRSDDHGE